ncbi:MAG: oxidoreductase [Acidobacteria bacterium]|nr:oxidoreductase [Acidobacteriota bacterium]
MSDSTTTTTTRRNWLRRSLLLAGGSTSAAVAARVADQYGLVPPDARGIWAPGHTLNYASHRLLAGDAPAREFTRDQISRPPHANGKPPSDAEYVRHRESGFADWRLRIEGMVERPGEFSVAELRAMPVRSQVTQVACEEGWSYIAEWTGVPLTALLERVGMTPKAKYVVYHSIQPRWWDSIDMYDALHPQTLVVCGMNGGTLPVGHGAPLRLRVPRQLGYKSVKYLTRLTVTDSLEGFGKGMGSFAAERGYAWYSGI